VIELAPRHIDAWVALARVYSAMGERDLAQEARAKAVQLNPALKR